MTQPIHGPAPAPARAGPEPLHADETPQAAEQAGHHAAANAVLAGVTAQPGTRVRHMAFFTRGATAAGNALAALVRSVRQVVGAEDTNAAGDAPPERDGTPLDDAGWLDGPATGAAPRWAVHGTAGTRDGRASSARAVGAAAGRSAAKGAGDDRTGDDRPVVAPVLASTAAIVRVRAPASVRRGKPPKGSPMLRTVGWGIALACLLVLVCAVWLILLSPAHAEEDVPYEDSPACGEPSQSCPS